MSDIPSPYHAASSLTLPTYHACPRIPNTKIPAPAQVLPKKLGHAQHHNATPPLHITTSLHHHITTSPHHHITTSPHHHITTSPHHHITTSPHPTPHTLKTVHTASKTAQHPIPSLQANKHMPVNPKGRGCTRLQSRRVESSQSGTRTNVQYACTGWGLYFLTGPILVRKRCECMGGLGIGLVWDKARFGGLLRGGD
ncbi:hypothetical protein IAQ61_007312 [Plenodomus lingam]|uniref:uncharacterized protein n=1 Tax=Leptosphaeria maculans TaxID=5022 RepID=UPI00331D6542|nr:hypothetical protein IAQ61_007312 [Plenodomus lingam]